MSNVAVADNSPRNGDRPPGILPRKQSILSYIIYFISYITSLPFIYNLYNTIFENTTGQPHYKLSKILSRNSGL